MSTTLFSWLVIGVLVLLVIWIMTVYNGLVAMRQRVNQAFSDIDVQTKQRHDLIPNLVETVKGYAGHERGTLEAVVRARNAAVTAQGGGVAAQAAAENALSGVLRQLFALSESYPDLKASQNFQQLQSELSDLENKIAAARRFFNSAVQEYTQESSSSRPCCSRTSSGLRPRISSTSASSSARTSSRRHR